MMYRHIFASFRKRVRTDGFLGIVGAGKEYRAIASTSIARPKAYISSEDGASFPEQIFEILPAYTIRKLDRDVGLMDISA
jgi:hypothetical protein